MSLDFDYRILLLLHISVSLSDKLLQQRLRETKSSNLLRTHVSVHL